MRLRMRSNIHHKLLPIAALIGLGFLLWYLRSWNLNIGDGEFCCKQTVGPFPYDITLSRAPLSHLLYRGMFFTLHPLIDWWVEDIIALSSCLAGVVFFWALYRLIWQTVEPLPLKWLGILFVPSTLLLHIFCGHIEFYPWTCALLMVSAYWAFRSIEGALSVFWPSAAMALAFGFHSSGVFYFPALLIIGMCINEHRHDIASTPKLSYVLAAACFGLFILTALLHREVGEYSHGELFQFSLLFENPAEYFFSQIYLLSFVLILGYGIYVYKSTVSPVWRQRLRPWWLIYLPWFVVFVLRAYFGLRDEPLLEHFPPFAEPYDHGAYLYMAFSWDHLYDKTLFHLWIAPFGLIGLAYFVWQYSNTIKQTPWLRFLLHYSIWAILWSTCFYPQLRTRDWDSFCSMAIPLNLFVFFCAYQFCNRKMFTWIFLILTFVHFSISLPVIVKNSAIFTDRGYVKLIYEPEPVNARAFIRGLELGHTPIAQDNIRAGTVEIRMVPLVKGYQSWMDEIYLEDGKTYTFSPHFNPIGE